MILTNHTAVYSREYVSVQWFLKRITMLTMPDCLKNTRQADASPYVSFCGTFADDCTFSDCVARDVEVW